MTVKWVVIYSKGYVNLMQNKNKQTNKQKVVHMCIVLGRELCNVYQVLKKNLRTSHLTFLSFCWQSKWDPMWSCEITRSRMCSTGSCYHKHEFLETARFMKGIRNSPRPFILYCGTMKLLKKNIVYNISHILREWVILFCCCLLYSLFIIIILWVYILKI